MAASSQIMAESLDDSDIVVHSFDQDHALLCDAYALRVSQILRVDNIFEKMYGMPKSFQDRFYPRSPVYIQDATSQKQAIKDYIRDRLKEYGKTYDDLSKAIKQALQETHVSLIDRVSKTLGKEKTIAVSGSNRQTRYMDKSNSFRKLNGCSAIALKVFCEILNKKSKKKILLDRFLLEDIAVNKGEGYCFNDMLKLDSLAGETEEAEIGDKSTIIDNEKIILLYIQMHRFASLYPKKNIALHFYDDNPGDLIFEKLIAFYKTYPQAMPHNVTLHIHKYVGPSLEKSLNAEDKEANLVSQAIYEKQEPIAGIKGVDKIDFNYQNTYKFMGKGLEHVSSGMTIPKHGEYFEHIMEVRMQQTVAAPSHRRTVPVQSRDDQSTKSNVRSRRSSMFSLRSDRNHEDSAAKGSSKLKILS